MTIGQVLDRISRCTTEAEANMAFDEIIEETARRCPDRPRQEIVAYTKDNIGYLSGYCDTATADRILRLFRTVHPIFGATRPTPEEALCAGQERAKAVQG